MLYKMSKTKDFTARHAYDADQIGYAATHLATKAGADVYNAINCGMIAASRAAELSDGQTAEVETLEITLYIKAYG